MDQGLADFDFQSFQDEIKSKPAAAPARARVITKRKPVTSLSATFYVCGPQDKTQKRLRELHDSLGADSIVSLGLRPDTVPEFETLLTRLRETAAELVSGTGSIEIGDNHRQHKCPLKLSCAHCWVGEHGANHTTANWIICNLLKQMYVVTPRELDVPERKDDASSSASIVIDDDDNWNVEEAEHGSYRYIPHEMQPFLIQAQPRTNSKLAKLQNLFQNVIPGFFAGTAGIPRIGALRAPAKLAEDRIWCKKPYCTRTLLAASKTDNPNAPACNKFHSDESSFLTTLLRILVECKMVARVMPEVTTSKVREPRAPRAPRPAAAAPAKAPVVAHNTFATLQHAVDDDDGVVAKPPAATDTPAANARLLELESKLREFERRNADALKYNKAMRERRDKLKQQIAAARTGQ